MKKLFLMLIIFVLLGCGRSTSDIKNKYDLPDELNDCKFYSMCSNGSCINVVRCPLSSTTTTYRCGKTTCSTMIVEVDTVGFGEYEKLKKKFNK